jgi:serine phosphatase RsbU (regulator of sigma subunit)
LVNHKISWARAKERRRYWQTVPLSALAWVALSAFLAAIPFGVAMDLGTALRSPFWWVLAKTAFYATAVGLFFIAGIRNRKLFFGFFPVYLLFSFMVPRVESSLSFNRILMSPAFEDVRWRLSVEGVLSGVAAFAGYVILSTFAATQGVRQVRERTELELAEKLQQTLAPPLAERSAGYEVHGRSAPSSQMGGDLLDAVDGGGAMACYVGDVAGHGIQAGVFMAMVKSAARTALLRPGSLEGLLADLNRVLFEVKAGSPTYVTFASVRCRGGGPGGGTVEYSLAGNGPILHYHARSKTTSQLAMEQFPLGMFAHATFQCGVVGIEPGDILTLLTDGLPEVEDDGHQQFGLDRIGEIVARNADGPLADTTEKIFAAVRQYGPQTDDETLVLVRAATPADMSLSLAL